MRLKLVALVVSAVSVLAGLSVIGTPATATGCRGQVIPHATQGGQAFDPWAGGNDAYWTGVAYVGRSPCSTGTQRIYYTHQSYTYNGGWVPYKKTSLATNVGYGQPARFGSIEETVGVWSITAKTTISWYTSGGTFLARKVFYMNGSSWYQCVDTRVCIVADDACRWHLHFLI